MYDLVVIFTVIVPTVAISIWWVTRRKSPPATPDIRHDLPAILFTNGAVEHASDAALAQLPIAIGAHNWQDLYDIFQPDFPGFPAAVLPVGSDDITLLSTQGQNAPIGTLHIHWLENGATLVFQSTTAGQTGSHSNEELAMLRQISRNLPHPAWKTDTVGNVIWHNEAYAALAARLPEGVFRAPAPIFDCEVKSGGTGQCRQEIPLADLPDPEWYSITRTPLAQGAVYHATSLTALIKAEDAQHDFVQTLAKTFAQLSTGLAIFNRDRQLALFNPALIDLTGLSVSFLSPRPTIDAFFDAMRENRRMPEPKNYKSWRERMAELVSAAETGRFEETWSLETGQTYRVTGRPHPDGAIAFLIEDISAEISLTRDYRAELELGQSLVDTFEDALAVFSQAGIQTFSNKAYDLLWGFNSETSFADVTIVDAIRLWKDKSAPNPLWQDLHDSVMALHGREAWTMPVCLKGQTPMQCKIVPIASGATVVRFSRQGAAAITEQPVSNRAKS